MLTNVDLNLRSGPFEGHRRLGVVAVEHRGPPLAPHQEIQFRIGGRDLAAHITAIQRNGVHVPHVYADAIHAEAPVADADCNPNSPDRPHVIVSSLIDAG